MKKIPALRRILIQNIHPDIRDEILKMFNKQIDNQEKYGSDFINQSDNPNNEFLIYFSKVFFYYFV